ncbi:hypothetical protein AVEN_123006-1 [Araneus ventricosus]|uniref:Pro-resilin n=1 Tax=Araneus ventricosus TaxID=182803 RepID=A0A4Y2CVW7_ARAVE|nr:hypothetical protein AVEN_123006-1 [Araneus ventricosus]
MHQLLFILVLGAAYCNAAEDDDSFSIGLGVLSPSYKQTVGKENVKVSFDQKENGQFSYSIGDPKTGYNSYLSFGGASANSAGNQAASPAAYSAPAAPSYSAPAAPSYSAPAASAGYSAPAAPSYAAPAAGYQPTGFANAPNYGSSSGYGAPSPAAGYSGSQGQAYNSYPSSSGAGSYGSGAAPARQPEDSSMILPAGFSYHATEGQAFLRNQAEVRQPAAGNILPAGFSYHATEGQSFLRNGGSPNFMVADEKRSSGLGIAEQSFYRNAGSNSQQGGRGLVNGLVGYGPGGPSSGNVPIGGYAGPQGTFREHGGHQ